ncbi:MAG: hypothetical protein OXC63_02085 [Aestuariivita sp.]|nr:hypothetical protein [Aestuariivita sp.]MCY4347606.1 hypothetical protein [Aestuariivita sp.]
MNSTLLAFGVKIKNCDKPLMHDREKRTTGLMFASYTLDTGIVYSMPKQVNCLKDEPLAKTMGVESWEKNCGV